MDRKKEIIAVTKRIQNYDLRYYEKFENMLTVRGDYRKPELREATTSEELNKINTAAIKKMLHLNMNKPNMERTIIPKVEGLQPVNDYSVDYI